MSIKLALGVPGAGKSLALQDMAYNLARDGWTIACRDMAREWAATTRDGAPNPRWRGQPPSLVAVPFGPDEPEEAVNCLRSHRDAVQYGEQGSILLFGYPWEGKEIAEVVRRVGDVVIIDDEIDLSCTYTDWEQNPFRDFFHRGRHLPDEFGEPREVHVLGAARRPQQLHIDAISLADEVLIFRVQGHRTLKRLTDEGMLTEEGAARIIQFPDLRYFLWKSTGGISEGELAPITQLHAT